jgi:hypothetical protein
MKSRVLDISQGMNGKQRVLIEFDEAWNDAPDYLQNTDVDVQIKRYRNKRSLDANAYAWVLIDKIAARLKLPKAEVYREAIREIGGVSTVVCLPEKAAEKLVQGWTKQGIGWQVELSPSKLQRCINATLYYGSSTYDTDQMANLIDRIVEEAKRLGIETATPDEIDRMKDLWSA